MVIASEKVGATSLSHYIHISIRIKYKIRTYLHAICTNIEIRFFLFPFPFFTPAPSLLAIKTSLGYYVHTTLPSLNLMNQSLIRSFLLRNFDFDGVNLIELLDPHIWG